ncbi:hypothetical protein BDV32DRAFT_130562, partial [Aspergillus pseudonomiae]
MRACFDLELGLTTFQRLLFSSSLILALYSSTLCSWYLMVLHLQLAKIWGD